MTFDDETLMAFADGELDLITAKRVEKAMASDPAVAELVAAHRFLRTTMAAAFPFDPRPDPLAAMIRANKVFHMPERLRPSRPRWLQATALAACLIAGVAVGTRWESGKVIQSSDGALVASVPLAGALETQLASAAGNPRMLVSFRNRTGDFCRVFEGQALAGIACKNEGLWKLVRTRSGPLEGRAGYRQAGSQQAALMAEAQNMTDEPPLDPLRERRARAAMWYSKR